MGLKRLSKNVNKRASAATRRIILILCIVAGILFIAISTLATAKNNVYEVQIYASQIDNQMAEKIAFIDTVANGVASGSVTGDMYDYVDTMAAVYEDVPAVYVCVPDAKSVNPDGYMTYMSGGWIPPEDFVVSERAWFIGAKDGDSVFVSEPYVDEQSGNICITLAKSIMKDGSFAGVVGLDMYMDDLVKLIESTYRRSGYIFLVSADGTILTHPSEEYALSATASKNVSEVKSYNKVYNNPLTNNYIIDYSGGVKFAAACTSELTGWTVISIATVLFVFIFILCVGILAIILATVVAEITKRTLEKSITPMFAPLEDLSNNVGRITEGELDYSFNVDEQSKEINDLSTALNDTMRGLQMYINQISDTVTAISKKDLSFVVDGDYVGDYEKIKIALIDIMNVLNESFQEINEQSATVLSFSTELADTSENVADSATNQSASVINASEEMKNLTANMEKVVEYANAIKNNTSKVNDDLTHGSEEMKQLVEAMDEIADCYEDIAGFLDEINNIADQTNLLSLNASIEAARAGEVGRGFAVVAGEISSLSESSSKSSAQIRDAIARSKAAVEKGKNLVDRTEKTFEDGVSSSLENEKMVSEIVRFVDTQKASAAGISSDLRDISSMVEGNAAAAEENSAISIQLGECAKALMDTIAQFKLK